MKTNLSLINKHSQNLAIGTAPAVLALLLFFGGAGLARASDPIGIYALIDKVVMAPNEKSPQTIQLWGVFALAEGRGETYSKPQRGYLFFVVDPDKPDVTQKEWADLKSVAGSRQAVGFSSRYPKKKP